MPDGCSARGRAWHESARVAAHGGDLADERGGDGANRRGSRQEDRLDLRRHHGVHRGHLHLVIEIGPVPQTADQDQRAVAPRRVDCEVREGRDLELGPGVRGHRRADRPEHFDPLLGGKDRRLRGVHPDRDHEPVDQPTGMAHHVQMPVRDGVESAGVKGYAGHEQALVEEVG